MLLHYQFQLSGVIPCPWKATQKPSCGQPPQLPARATSPCASFWTKRDFLLCSFLPNSLRSQSRVPRRKYESRGFEQNFLFSRPFQSPRVSANCPRLQGNLHTSMSMLALRSKKKQVPAASRGPQMLPVRLTPGLLPQHPVSICQHSSLGGEAAQGHVPWQGRSSGANTSPNGLVLSFTSCGHQGMEKHAGNYWH